MPENYMVIIWHIVSNYIPEYMTLTRLIFDQACETMNKPILKPGKQFRLIIFSYTIRKSGRKTGFTDTVITYRHL